MKKLRVAILFLVIVGMFGVVILRCPPMPTRSLAFGIRMTAPTNEALNTISKHSDISNCACSFTGL